MLQAREPQRAPALTRFNPSSGMVLSNSRSRLPVVCRKIWARKRRWRRLCRVGDTHNGPCMYRARLKGGSQVWWILFLLLQDCSARIYLGSTWLCFIAKNCFGPSMHAGVCRHRDFVPFFARLITSSSSRSHDITRWHRWKWIPNIFAVGLM